MARFWFTSAPLFSHTDWGGFLKTAQTLQASGHEVIWVSGEAIRRAIEQADLPFIAVEKTGWLWPPPPPLDLTMLSRPDANRLRYQRALDTWLTEGLVGEATTGLIELARKSGKPDVIVSDPFLSAAAFAAEALEVPFAVCGWPAMCGQPEATLMPVQRALSQASHERIEHLCKHFGLTGLYFSDDATPTIRSTHIHISYFSETWHQADRDNLLPQNLFVGGVPNPPQDAPPEWLAAISPDMPLALITQGTTFAGDLVFFAQAAQAVANAGFIPVVVLGWHPIEAAQKQRLVASLPPGTRLLNWVNFAHVLPRTELMIHHGGMGTTHAAIIHAVPQMILPRAADQRGQARRAAQAKVGLNLTTHDVRNGALVEGAQALKNDPRVQASARDLAAEFAALGGAKHASEALLALLP